MDNGSLTVIVAGACLLLAALALAQGRRIAPWLAGAGVAILAGALAARGLRAGRWPFSNVYEVALAFALTTALAALLARCEEKQGVHFVLSIALLFSALLVAYAWLLGPDLKRIPSTLPPILDSVWFPLHAGTAALAYGALAFAGAAGAAWLLWDRTATKAEERAQKNAERLLFRAIAAGFPLLTLSIIFGMIWAQTAWGQYWSWDLKETWTLITWLIYALYWHVRRRVRWRGRRVAWLTLIGLTVVLFSFLGVDWLARSISVGGI